MQEEYGIKLKILTDSLKNDMNKTKTMIKGFANDLKSGIKFGFNYAENERDLAKMKSRLKNLLKEKYSIDVNFGKDGSMEAVSGLSTYLNALKSATKEEQQEVLKLGNEIRKMSYDINNINDNKFATLGMKVRNAVDSVKDSWREARTPVEIEVDTNKFDSQIKYLESRITILQSKLKDKDISVIDTIKTEASIERLSNQLNNLKNKTKEVGEEAEETKTKMSGIAISSNMTSSTIVKGLGRGLRELRNFALALLSVRGIYGLVRKAVLAYKSQDEQLNKQMEKTWASLGALVVPIIEKIVYAMRVASAYINYFVKALTGRNLIAEAIKRINKYNKSLAKTKNVAKSARKELTSLDEITNLSFDNKDSNEIEDAVKSFDDFSDIKLNPKITKILDTVAEAVKKVNKFLKPIVDWAIEHPDTVLKILGGVALLSTLAKLTGGGAGSLGALATNLLTLGAIGVITVGVVIIVSSIKKVSDAMDKFNSDIEENTKQSNENAKANEKRNKIYEQGLKDGKKTDEEYKKEADFLLNTTKRRERDNETLQEQKSLFNDIYAGLTRRKSANAGIQKQEKNNHKVIYDNLIMLKKYNDAGKLTVDQKKDYKQALIDEIDWLGKELKSGKLNAEQTKKYKNNVKELKEQFETLTGRKYNAKVDVSTEEATNKVEALTKGPLNILKNGVWKAKADIDDKLAKDKATKLKDSLTAFAKKYCPQVDLKVGTKTAKKNLTDFIKKSNKALVATNLVDALKGSVLQTLLDAIPGYDVGTPYVPNDMIAQVHKGEMIVPAKYNPVTNGMNVGNVETNALLYELNKNVLELSNKPTVLRVNGKDLAEATYTDFKNEGNRLNASKTINIK